MFQITDGVQLTPIKVVLYGPEGIGKSTFASQFPNPLFIDTEESTKMMNVRRFKRPGTWEELLQMVDYVKQNPTVCSTLIIDTADWAERLCETSVCRKGAKRSIEDFGYGKGYTIVAEEFGHLLDMLTALTSVKVNVVLTAHSLIRKFERPDESGAYDRYELKLGNKAGSKCSALVKEWCDLLLFANYKEIVSDVNGKKKAQGGRRVMYTSHHPCWDAKNRLALKDELAFDYKEIAGFVFDYHKPAPNAKTEEKPIEGKPVSHEKALEIEQVGFGKSPREAAEAVERDNARKHSDKAEKAPQKRAMSPQEQVLANAKKAGVTPQQLAVWAVDAGCFAPDKEKYPETNGFMPIMQWPSSFIKEVIIPNWAQVVQAAKVDIPF